MRLLGLLPPVAALVLVAACSPDGDGSTLDDGPASASIRTTTSDVVTDATTRPRPAVADPGSTVPSDDPAAPDASEPPATTPPPTVGDPVVASEVVGEFDQPVDLAVRPGDDALWVVEQGGRVVRFDGEAGVALDLTDRVIAADRRGNEQGLLGLAFSPDGTVAYANYTDGGGDTVIAEFRVGNDGVIEAASERVVLLVAQPFRNHNAGDLAFGPDGYLYVPLGDGGSGGDPQRNGSNPTTMLGSILRIDPTASDGAAYTVPADNPFADGAAVDGTTGLPEVWSWGLRNPWKIAFDPVTSELWIADVGQNRFEEVDVVAPANGAPAGRAVDFGWSAFEGNARFDSDVPDDGTSTPPVLTYSHADGCSISGGVPYRGTAIAELAPAYVYSDFCNSTIWAFDLAGSRNLTLLEGFEGVTAVRTGPDRELYVLERSGTVHRLVPG